jgi:hypothetical protein
MTTMAAHDYHKIGQAARVKDPIFFRLLEDFVKDCQETSITDTALINSYFFFFCQYKGVAPEEIRAVARRGSLELMSVRRQFIAVILKLYDQLYYEGVAQRMTDKLRKNISDCLNCNEIWVSNVAPSVKHELRNLKGYDNEVQIIIDAIQPHVEDDSMIVPEYYNSRSLNNQLSMFE